MKLIYTAIIAFIIFLQGCQLLEINIVQRSLLTDGQGIESSSVETNLRKEESNMKFAVPLK